MIAVCGVNGVAVSIRPPYRTRLSIRSLAVAILPNEEPTGREPGGPRYLTPARIAENASASPRCVSIARDALAKSSESIASPRRIGEFLRTSRNANACQREYAKKISPAGCVSPQSSRLSAAPVWRGEGAADQQRQTGILVSEKQTLRARVDRCRAEIESVTLRVEREAK